MVRKLPKWMFTQMRMLGEPGLEYHTGLDKEELNHSGNPDVVTQAVMEQQPVPQNLEHLPHNAIDVPEDQDHPGVEEDGNVPGQLAKVRDDHLVATY
jgi:hypothetical protein